MTEPTDGLREALARWLFERGYRERGLASPDDAPWDEWSDRNQDEWREEAEELLSLPVVIDWAERRARELCPGNHWVEAPAVGFDWP